MLKHKFYKNLFQTISYFAVIMFLDIFLLIGYFESLRCGPNYGWILLIISISLIVLFFLIGFYWIFQIVSIDVSGIKILFNSRIIKQLKWEEIDTIEKSSILNRKSTIYSEENIEIKSKDRIRKGFCCIFVARTFS